MKINLLPDLCLLAIFDRLPLVDLVHQRRVCHLWYSLLSHSAIRRRSLTLYETVGPIDKNTLCLHRGPDFGRPNYELGITWIENTLKNIRSLSIIYSQYMAFSTFEGYFLGKFGPNLVKLSLFSLPAFALINPMLIDFINTKLPNLRSLALDLSKRNSLRELPVIIQLNELMLKFGLVRLTTLRRVATQYLESCDSLVRCEFEFPKMPKVGELIAQLSPAAARRITKLTPIGFKDFTNFDTLQHFCSTFTSFTDLLLNEFTLAQARVNWAQFFECLLPMTRLKRLRFTLCRRNFIEDHFAFHQQLPSVTSIEVSCYLGNHSQLLEEGIDFERIFPQLERATIVYRNSADCSTCPRPKSAQCFNDFKHLIVREGSNVKWDILRGESDIHSHVQEMPAPRRWL